MWVYIITYVRTYSNYDDAILWLRKQDTGRRSVGTPWNRISLNKSKNSKWTRTQWAVLYTRGRFDEFSVAGVTLAQWEGTLYIIPYTSWYIYSSYIYYYYFYLLLFDPRGDTDTYFYTCCFLSSGFYDIFSYIYTRQRRRRSREKITRVAVPWSS